MNGIVYIAFGREYEKIARHTIAYSRKMTNIRMTLFTNVPERRRGKYEGVNVVYLKMRDNQNREIKTQLNKWTPYDTTLYMDVDAVIQRKGIEKVFDFEGDIALHQYLEFKKGEKILSIYYRAMQLFGVSRPLKVYNGAFILFKKGKVRKFFDLWHYYWKAFGRAREMPPLACAIKKLGIEVSPIGVKVAVDALDPEATLQHDCVGFIKKFSFPKYDSSHPGDNPSDFKWL